MIKGDLELIVKLMIYDDLYILLNTETHKDLLNLRALINLCVYGDFDWFQENSHDSRQFKQSTKKPE